jgi:hypothetical protein
MSTKINLSVRWKWFIGVGLSLTFLSANAEALTSAAAAPTATAHRGDPDIQQKRLAFMKNTIALGLIKGIDDNSPITRVRVGPKFISLPAGEKEAIINVVWAYYKTEDVQKNVVLVIDQKSGKEIGEYSLAKGGLKMK